MKIKRIAGIAVALLLIGAAVHGSVFRAFNVPKGRLNVSGLPWEFAYRTTMQINGERNELELYSARFNEPVLQQLKDCFEAQGAAISLVPSKDGARGVAKWEDKTARILVLSPETRPNQLIFLFYPDGKKNASSGDFPVPVYPRARDGETVSNEKTGTVCKTLLTEDAVESVQQFYADVLANDGWSLVLPPRLDGVSVGSMAMYQKNERICCVMTSGNPGMANRVTLLVKGGGL